MGRLFLLGQALFPAYFHAVRKLRGFSIVFPWCNTQNILFYLHAYGKTQYCVLITKKAVSSL